MTSRPPHEKLGAHVSTAGGVQTAPARGRAIGATAIQVFTKTPNQWREPVPTDEQVATFQAEMARSDLRAVVSHDSYLINLASPDRALRARSIACFKGELARCRAYGIPYVVTHPGNFMDDRGAGLVRNAEAYVEALAAEPGPMILIETTAGSGTALGARFDELAELRARVPASLRDRIGFCADTCHLYAAGYDIVDAWDEVWAEWDRTIGLAQLRCFHLNDSRTPFGSRRDRHALIAEGTLGAKPFRSVMRDPRFRDVVKVIETPKGDDPVKTDRRMLRRLRAYARGPRRRA
ncbi:MAG TPA: deoxyribonuclease IV [Gemmatimonadales bacterium]|nr:deoxyribonuclease IV [Gemmatimonadales bacterium]